MMLCKLQNQNQFKDSSYVSHKCSSGDKYLLKEIFHPLRRRSPRPISDVLLNKIDDFKLENEIVR